MKHKYYKDLNEKFAIFNEMTCNEVRKIKELESKIIEFKGNQDEIIMKSFREMMSKIIKIDGNKPVLHDISEINPEDYKEGLVTKESALTFLMKENRVMSLDLVSQKLIEIETLQETYNAKLLPISNMSLLAIGG